MFRAKIYTLIIILLGAISAQAETIKVKLKTTMGNIPVDLYADKAPITVANFLRYIDGGLFEFIKLEHTNLTGIKHQDGTISMARGGPDTASSIFFICLNYQPSLDFEGMRNADGQGFTAFGKVTMGMAAVCAIQNVKTDTPEGTLKYTSGQHVLDPVIINSFSRE